MHVDATLPYPVRFLEQSHFSLKRQTSAYAGREAEIEHQESATRRPVSGSATEYQTLVPDVRVCHANGVIGRV